jgi:hypothetical protein
MEAQRILRTLKQFDEQVQANPEEIIKLLGQHGVELQKKPNFEFAFFQDGFGVVETSTNTAIGLRA